MLRRRPSEEQLTEIAGSLPFGDQDLLRAARAATLDYDAAIRRDDSNAANQAAAIYDAVVFKLNGMTNFGCVAGPEAPGYVVARYCATEPGEPGRWGAAGAFVVQNDQVRAVLKNDGGWGITGGYSWHVIDLDKPFFSNTGYLSSTSLPIIWGAAFPRAALIHMEAIIRGERRLVPIPADAWVRTRPSEFPWVFETPKSAMPRADLSKGDVMAFPL